MRLKGRQFHKSPVVQSKLNLEIKNKLTFKLKFKYS